MGRQGRPMRAAPGGLEDAAVRQFHGEERFQNHPRGIRGGRRRERTWLESRVVPGGTRVPSTAWRHPSGDRGAPEPLLHPVSDLRGSGECARLASCHSVASLTSVSSRPCQLVNKEVRLMWSDIVKVSARSVFGVLAGLHLYMPER